MWEQENGKVQGKKGKEKSRGSGKNMKGRERKSRNMDGEKMETRKVKRRRKK